LILIPKTIAEVTGVLHRRRFVFVRMVNFLAEDCAKNARIAYRVTGQRSSAPAHIGDRFEAVGFASPR